MKLYHLIFLFLQNILNNIDNITNLFKDIKQNHKNSKKDIQPDEQIHKQLKKQTNNHQIHIDKLNQYSKYSFKEKSTSKNKSKINKVKSHSTSKIIPVTQDQKSLYSKPDEKGNENGSLIFTDQRQPNSKANCNINKQGLLNPNSQQDRPEHPPNPFGKTIIDLDVELSKIRKLDLDLNTWTTRGSMSIAWCDPRLKFDRKQGEYKMQQDDGADLVLEFGVIWTPEIRIRNGYSPRVADNIRIQMFQDGTVLQRERFVADVMDKFDLTKIPFDTQTLTMDIGSLTFDDDFIMILEELQTVKIEDNFHIAGFDFIELKQDMRQFTDRYNKRIYSYLHAQYIIKRNYWTYCLKIILPIMFLICISSVVFWQPNENLQERLVIILNSIFATIAYQIVVEEKVPRYSFSNFLNLSVFMAICCMATACLLCWVLRFLVIEGKGEAASKICKMLNWWQICQQIVTLVDLQLWQVLEMPIGGLLIMLWLILGVSIILQQSFENPEGMKALINNEE